jgi:hypothetical protein
MNVLVKNIDPSLFRKQRMWLLSQDMTDECEGLVALCDHISDEMEIQGETRQDITTNGGN